MYAMYILVVQSKAFLQFTLFVYHLKLTASYNLHEWSVETTLLICRNKYRKSTSWWLWRANRWKTWRVNAVSGQAAWFWPRATQRVPRAADWWPSAKNISTKSISSRGGQTLCTRPTIFRSMRLRSSSRASWYWSSCWRRLPTCLRFNVIENSFYHYLFLMYDLSYLFSRRFVFTYIAVRDQNAKRLWPFWWFSLFSIQVRLQCQLSWGNPIKIYYFALAFLRSWLARLYRISCTKSLHPQIGKKMSILG